MLIFKKMSFFSLELTQLSLLHQKLFQPACDTKINKIKDINMVSIKRNTHFIHWNIFPFSQNNLATKGQQNYQIILNTASINMPIKKLSEKTSNHTQTFFLKYFLPKFTWIFKKTELNRKINGLLSRFNPKINHNFFLNYSTCSNTEYLYHLISW